MSFNLEKYQKLNDELDSKTNELDTNFINIKDLKLAEDLNLGDSNLNQFEQKLKDRW